MERVKCFGLLNMFKEEILYVDTLREKFLKDYKEELERIIQTMSKLNLEKMKQNQRIQTSYGCWYLTNDNNTDCVFCILIDNNYSQEKSLQILQKIQKLIYKIPRYHDKNTDLEGYLQFKVKLILAESNSDEPINMTEEEFQGGSLQSLNLDFENIPLNLISKEHQQPNSFIDIQKIKKQQDEQFNNILSKYINNYTPNIDQQQINDNKILGQSSKGQSPISNNNGASIQQSQDSQVSVKMGSEKNLNQNVGKTENFSDYHNKQNNHPSHFGPELNPQNFQFQLILQNTYFKIFLAFLIVAIIALIIFLIFIK